MNWNLENLTYDQLAIIRDRFILADKVTANKDLTGLAFTETFKKTIIDQVKNVNGKILVINDLGFHITKGLLEKGAEKVYLLMTQFITVNKPKLKKNGEYSYRKNGEISTTKEVALDDKKLYNLYKHLPIIRDNDKVVLITAEEFYSMGTEENKFDLIIANPPYDMGNTIISNCVDKAKECVVLMPFFRYKANELYKHVLSLEIVDPKAFKDAVITTNLCVCKLIPNKIERTLEELEIETFDQRYREFYELNQKMPNKITYPHATFFYDGADKNAYETAKNDLINWWKDHNKKFCLTWRAVQNGTHNYDGDAYDVLWNVKKELDMNNLPISQSPKRNNTSITISLVDFKTEKECSNFTKFFYANGKDGLMNALVKGMNKTSGTIQPAIPNIDWPIDRDYEHLTYEELLQIMKDELANQKK